MSVSGWGRSPDTELFAAVIVVRSDADRRLLELGRKAPARRAIQASDQRQLSDTRWTHSEQTPLLIDARNVIQHVNQIIRPLSVLKEFALSKCLGQ